jgi:predicted GNAT family acetyltransferase
MTVFRASADASEFLECAGDYLRAHPVEHSVILTNAERRVGTDGPNNLWAWLAAADGTVRGAAMHTPPYGLAVSVAPDEAIDALAAGVFEHGRDLPGVGGPRRQAEAFAAAWSSRTGAPVSLSARHVMYAADAATPPAGVPGRLRRAESGEVPLLCEWLAAFFRDTRLPAESKAEVTERVADGRMYVWDVDGRPVSMAGVTVPVGGVVRVVMVYTPPNLRGRGYASCGVAALTELQLAVPGRTCMLYADLGNDTSNGIYQAIGYRPIGEAVQLAFG